MVSASLKLRCTLTAAGEGGERACPGARVRGTLGVPWWTKKQQEHTSGRRLQRMAQGRVAHGLRTGCRAWCGHASCAAHAAAPMPTLTGGRGLAGGKHIGVVAPHKLQRLAKGLVAPGQGGVDDILAVAAHSDKAAVGRVLQCLGVDVGGAQVLDSQGQPLAVRLQGVGLGWGKEGLPTGAGRPVASAEQSLLCRHRCLRVHFVRMQT